MGIRITKQETQANRSKEAVARYYQKRKSKPSESTSKRTPEESRFKAAQKRYRNSKPRGAFRDLRDS